MEGESGEQVGGSVHLPAVPSSTQPSTLRQTIRVSALELSNNNNNKKHVLTTSVNLRRPSVHKRLVTPLFENGSSAITSLFFVVDRKE